MSAAKATLLRRARTLDELMVSVGDRGPLEGAAYDEFRVDADKARGYERKGLAAKVSKFFRNNWRQHPSVLFAGHTGSGKTTELHGVARSLESEFHVIPVPVAKELDSNNLEYVDLLILIYELIFRHVTAPDEFGRLVDLDDDLLDRTHDWLREIVQTTEFVQASEVKAEAGLKGAISGFFGSLTSSFRAATNHRVLIRQQLEPSITGLIAHCNTLIKTVETRLATAGYKQNRLLLVVEDLDKLGPGVARSLFYQNGHLLSQLAVNAIYTIPNALLFGPESSVLDTTFQKKFILQTIKTRTKQHERFEEGISCLIELLHKRFEPDLFAEGVLDLLALKCGGLIRDMLDVISEASLEADDDETQISLPLIRYGLDRKREDYARRIAPKEEDGITTEMFRQRLREIASGRGATPDNDLVLQYLLLSSLAIEYYNGDRWVGVHPLVEEYLENIDRT